jgi:hypothetical protein
VSPRRPQPPGTILRTVTRRMSRAELEDEMVLAAARCLLLDELTEWADRCGYTRSVTRESVNHDSLTLTGMMSPRTDGQWPSIHRAVAEDALDRQELRNTGDPF